MRIIYCTYLLIVALPVLAIVTILAALTTIVGCTCGYAKFWGYWPARIWSWCMIRVLLLPVHVEGREKIDKKTSYVFVANHQGNFDIFLIYAFLGHDLRWMMKKSLRKIFLIGKACESAGHIFVDKRGPKAIKKTYDTARNILQGGASVVVFPEGARTFTGHMGYFKKGAFQLADELQLPVVPITLNGPFDVMPRTTSNPFIKRAKLSIIVHDPIFPNGKGHESELETMEKAYNAVMGGLPKDRQGYVQNDDQ